MARIRSVKPEIAADKKLASVSREARYHFVLLWTVADDAGYFRANPRQLLGQLYPHDEDMTEACVEALIVALERGGFVRVYLTDDGPIGCVVNWSKHQKIDRPSRSHLREYVAHHSCNPREVPSEGVLSLDLGVLSQDLTARRETAAPGQVKPDDRTTAEQSDHETLWSLIRTHLYAPDGLCPPDWSESREGSILKALRKQHTTSAIAAAIQGVAVIRDEPGRYGDVVTWLTPHTKATLRVLYHTSSGATPLWSQATHAFWKRENTQDDPRRRGQFTPLAALLTPRSA